MLMPSIFRENLLDDFMDSFGGFPTRNYSVGSLMNTDVKEKDGHYELTMDIPGVKKEDVHAELKDGYLTIHASVNAKRDDKDDLLGTKGDGCHPVARAVDIHNDAILSQCIGTGEIIVGMESLAVDGLCLLAVGSQVTVVELIVATGMQGCRDSHVAQGHRTAPGDAASCGQLLQQTVNSLAGCGTITGLDVAAPQTLDQMFCQMGIADICRCIHCCFQLSTTKIRIYSVIDKKNCKKGGKMAKKVG